jgi:hypothetical protein
MKPKITDERLIKKLKNFTEDLEAVQMLINKVPVCADYIIENNVKKVEGYYQKIADRYKSLNLPWGIMRTSYSNNFKPTNFTQEIVEDKILCNIYINTYPLLNTNNKFGLDDLRDLVFYYDKVNNTFYATDEELPVFLEALHDWYLKTKEKTSKIKKDLEIEALEKKIEALERKIETTRNGD